MRYPDGITSRFSLFEKEELDAISDGLISEWEAARQDSDPEIQRRSEIAGDLLAEFHPDWR